MPPRPKKICTYYGCHAFTVGKSARCEQHTVKAWARTYEKGGRAERGYGTAWMKLRVRILKRDNYLCHCPDCLGGRIRLRPATEVDHIIPKSEPGSTDDPSNLRAVNVDCHKKLTAEQAARSRRNNAASMA